MYASQNLSAPVIPAKRWTHVAGVYDSETGVARVYVNARPRASSHGKGLLSQDWDGHAGIGNHKGGRFLKGEIDEFRIYNKVLTTAAIEDLMRRCQIPNSKFFLCFLPVFYGRPVSGKK